MVLGRNGELGNNKGDIFYVKKRKKKRKRKEIWEMVA